MTEKETGELRRRFRPDRTNITAVCGCYASGSGEILSVFRQSFGLMTEDDKEKYLSLFKRVLSGTPDKNRVSLSFRTSQVADSNEHRLLMRLRDTELRDEDALNALYNTIIGSWHSEEHYLILVAHENYDVPFKSKDVASPEDSTEVFSYIVCAVCPVKQAKEQLSYDVADREFHIRSAGYAAGAPEAGFLFPAFDGRRTNLYECLYYTRTGADNHEDLVRALFDLEPPLPADQQKQTFTGLLSQTLSDECSLDVVQAVREELAQRIEAHKELESDEPLVVSRDEVGAILKDSGVSDEHLASFNVRFDESFGDDAVLSPRNLIDTKKVQLKTPDVVIQVNPERAGLIETRVMGGVKYIVICADEGVEVNGVDITIQE